MSDVQPFGTLVLLCSVAVLLAVLSNRLTARLRVPAPAVFFAAAAVAGRLVPDLRPSQHTVARVVTVALLLILLDGGAGIGWRRFRQAAAPIALAGVVGTFLTAGGLALVAHLVLGTDVYLSLLVGTALSPTDPAVVFSVLGGREVKGRSGTVLEGESGANDPVGIALLASLLAAGGVSGGGVAHIAGEFALQMAVGLVIGVVGGRLLLELVRRVPLPGEGLYPLRTVAGAVALYGLATVLHGSGFLAVFVAGIALGDPGAPYKREVQRFSSALASLAEVVAFVVLGLTVDLDVLGRADVLLPGIVLFGALSLVVRPLLLGLCLWPVALSRGERGFVLLAGLKGAVPLLLGSFLLAENVPQAQRLYGVVVVVVMLSVVVQGGLVPSLARWFGLPMTHAPVEPFAVGVRLADEPDGVLRLTVRAGSQADGLAVSDLDDVAGEVWVSLVVRDRQLVDVRGSTLFAAGDEVVLLAGEAQRVLLREALTTPVSRPSGSTS